MTTETEKVEALQYEVHMELRISHKEGYSYDSKADLKFSVSGLLPMNVDPEKWVRARLAEEVRRSFGQLPAPLKNRTVPEAEVDPLVPTQGTSDIPF